VEIQTKRLLLRPFTPADFDSLYAIFSDAEVMRYYPKPYDAATTQRWLDWNLQNYREHGFGIWAVILKETGAFIGDCGLTMQNIDGQLLPEIGYHFHKNYWRQGFGSEAAKAVRDWFFENTAYDSVYSYMTEANIPSQATAAANGMKKIKDYLDKDNTVTCVYEITRQDWAALSLAKST